MVALRRAALHEAQSLFASGRVAKTYWAVVAGVPAEESGVVNLPLAKLSTKAGWRMRPGSGQEAVTDWVVRGRGDGLAWLELHPRTGRTHQVRVHCAALGCPVLGDPVYGAGDAALHLLARSIQLPMDPPVAATAPVPTHMVGALGRCGWQPMSTRRRHATP